MICKPWLRFSINIIYGFVICAPIQMLCQTHLPFKLIRDAHAKLLSSCLHSPANHQPIARFKDVQRAGDCGKCHCADKDRHFHIQAAMKLIQFKENGHYTQAKHRFLHNQDWQWWHDSGSVQKYLQWSWQVQKGQTYFDSSFISSSWTFLLSSSSSLK